MIELGLHARGSRPAPPRMGWLLATCVAAASLASAEDAGPLVVTADTVLPAGTLRRPIVIAASGITVEGAPEGTEIVGPGRAGDPASYRGTGISAVGRGGDGGLARDAVLHDVTIRGVTVRGFRTGVVLERCRRFTIERCDLSGNHDDPAFGWGDGELTGGILLKDVGGTTIRECRGRRNWNGLALVRSDGNVISGCDFSRCSNTCLKLETSSRNVVRDCVLSYGLRIRPGEVHARDSTGVLIESGSDDNRFERNDVTHGGDGIFIRVLNARISTGNVFIENDCSHANNNAFESWSPGNTFIRNRANHSSYGFWLGGSDHTVLIGNEAAWNGLPSGFHNAPEPDFGHGGIVIVGGTGTHTLIEGNHCHHNAGAGIVVRGDLPTRGGRWRMEHLVVQRNRLEHNRWGFFARFTHWVDMAGNRFARNEEDLHLEEVTALARRPDDPGGHPRPRARLSGPRLCRTGEEVVFDASASRSSAGRSLEWRWEIGPPAPGAPRAVYRTPRVRHTFREPGFHRVGLTVTDGFLADPAWLDVLVVSVSGDDELATEGGAARWRASAGKGAVVTVTDTGGEEDHVAAGAPGRAVGPRRRDGPRLLDPRPLRGRSRPARPRPGARAAARQGGVRLRARGGRPSPRPHRIAAVLRGALGLAAGRGPPRRERVVAPARDPRRRRAAAIRPRPRDRHRERRHRIARRSGPRLLRRARLLRSLRRRPLPALARRAELGGAREPGRRARLPERRLGGGDARRGAGTGPRGDALSPPPASPAGRWRSRGHSPPGRL